MWRHRWRTVREKAWGTRGSRCMEPSTPSGTVSMDYARQMTRRPAMRAVRHAIFINPKPKRFQPFSPSHTGRRWLESLHSACSVCLVHISIPSSHAFSPFLALSPSHPSPLGSWSVSVLFCPTALTGARFCFRLDCSSSCPWLSLILLVLLQTPQTKSHSLLLSALQP